MLILLCILIFISNFGSFVYFALGEEPLPAFEFLSTASFLCGVVWWLRADAKRTVINHVYCPGLLIGNGWFVAIPYHLFKTRGVRALIPLAALLLSFIMAYIAALIVLFVFAPERIP
jgi:hypothetical protein